jgi:hypothetical protein
MRTIVCGPGLARHLPAGDKCPIIVSVFHFTGANAAATVPNTVMTFAQSGPPAAAMVTKRKPET